MAKRPKGKGERNDQRRNGKAYKKRPKKQKKTGRTIGGYSKAKLAIRAAKRANRDNNLGATVSRSSGDLG